MEIKKRKCEYCKSYYNIIQNTQKYCSKKCRQNSQYYRNRKTILENKRKRIWKGRKEERRKYEIEKNNKFCIICKSKLNNNQRKYCSKNCKHKDWYIRKWHSFFKHKYSIKIKARNETYSKKIEKKECNICKSKNRLEYHHITYNPNVVIILCKICHINIHKRNRGDESDN